MIKIKDLWDKIPDEKKKPTAVVLTIAGLFLVVMLAYKGKTITEDPKPVKKDPTIEVGYDKAKLQGGIIATVDTKVKGVQDDLGRLTKLVEGLSNDQKQSKAEFKALTDQLGQQIEKAAENPGKKRSKNDPPPPPNPNNRRATGYQNYPPPPDQLTALQPPKPEIVYVGGIHHDRSEIKVEEKDKDDEKKNEIYLPPSFMPATLLAGITAPTMAKDREDPMPVLVRVNDLAVLPNKVKADLKGCFIFGEAEGKLRDSRAHSRITLLSCIDKKGGGVIEEEIRGYITDGEDGKVGMAGRAVAKMDLAVSRAVWAGLIGGLGEGVKMSTTQSQFTDTGNVNQILSSNDTQTILKYGIGQGISDGAKELQKFYLALAEESGPVIEVGATKMVTVVITKGVTLHLKKQNLM